MCDRLVSSMMCDRLVSSMMCDRLVSSMMCDRLVSSMVYLCAVYVLVVLFMCTRVMDKMNS